MRALKKAKSEAAAAPDRLLFPGLLLPDASSVGGAAEGGCLSGSSLARLASHMPCCVHGVEGGRLGEVGGDALCVFIRICVTMLGGAWP